MIKRRERLRDGKAGQPGWGTYKKKWGPIHDSIAVSGRDTPLEIRPLRT